MYYMKLSFTEVYNFPIGLKNYYIKKLIEIKEEEAKAINKGKKK